eukprot:CAMPEP_0176007668 /NCGR_PEP_ID=MMETSP0120_2-20121206/3350_1 /TAXON_ID=160619 /ORGANISM="Kryptoperidinium foliaceum, Strain CCMP 1326" /LENGTH=107 /DNA_ID=CAMNT_0017340433 /DNA_START=175 /DNA_END=498 /DNA_ORIENTATION=+
MSFFARLTPNQRVWGAVGGVIIAGSVFKVAYFKLCRTVLVEQANRTHLDATEHYREAKEFAKWSAKDREARRAELPPLTLEQEQQMRAYIRLMQEHHAFNPDSERGN